MKLDVFEYLPLVINCESPLAHSGFKIFLTVEMQRIEIMIFLLIAAVLCKHYKLT